MKITMVGDAAVGKTTFMMTVYGLMRRGLEGFKIECKDKHADQVLALAYERFCKFGYYPDPTIQMKSYEYDFYNGIDWVMQFTLNDIRGESIHDYDITELQKQIRESDAVMLFLNAYDVYKGIDQSDSVDELSMILNNSFIVDEKPKLLMVVYTQFDRIPSSRCEETVKALDEAVSELEQMSQKNDNFLYERVVTSCTPRKIMNLDYVMGVLMLIGYAREVAIRKEKLEQELAEIQTLWGTGFWRGLKYFFFGDSRRDAAAKRAQTLSEIEIPKYERMQKNFNRLGEFCSKYELGTYYDRAQREDVFTLA